MTRKRIVMLDFDGVINKERRFYDGLPIERELAQKVAHLVTALDASVVVSSDWRHHYNLQELRTILQHFGDLDPKRVLGTTHTPREQGSGIRGEEIARWLERHKHPVQLAVLDDNHLGRFNMDVVRPWFIKTNPRYGVTKANLQQAKALLTSGPVFSRQSVALDKQEAEAVV